MRYWGAALLAASWVFVDSADYVSCGAAERFAQIVRCKAINYFLVKLLTGLSQWNFERRSIAELTKARISLKTLSGSAWKRFLEMQYKFEVGHTVLTRVDKHRYMNALGY